MPPLPPPLSPPLSSRFTSFLTAVQSGHTPSPLLKPLQASPRSPHLLTPPHSPLQIWGVTAGYNGLSEPDVHEWVPLEPKTVREIHMKGGSILKATRGSFEPTHEGGCSPTHGRHRSPVHPACSPVYSISLTSCARRGAAGLTPRRSATRCARRASTCSSSSEATARSSPATCSSRRRGRWTSRGCRWGGRPLREEDWS